VHSAGYVCCGRRVSEGRAVALRFSFAIDTQTCTYTSFNGALATFGGCRLE
jgi:hypothetical protein